MNSNKSTVLCIISFKNSRQSRWEFLNLIIHDCEFLERLENLWYRSTHSCTNIKFLWVWGYFGLKNWMLSLAVSLSHIKTLIKHTFLLFFSFWIINEILKYWVTSLKTLPNTALKQSIILLSWNHKMLNVWYVSNHPMALNNHEGGLTSKFKMISSYPHILLVLLVGLEALKSCR